LQIPESYKIFSPSKDIEEQFLLADSGPGNDRILIFGRQKSLDVLFHSKTWFGDGTFRTAPLLFTQVYVILAEQFGGVHPIIFALLPDKQSKTYEKLFDMLLKLKPGLDPVSISLDFELAVINSVQKYFKNAQIFGCFFHLTKNFRKKMGELHLLSIYANDSEFSIATKMIISLAFVCINDLDNAIDVLSNYLPEELQSMLEWFEDNYIGRMNRNNRNRRKPRFAPQTWNLYQRVLNYQNKTNNHAEAANRRLNIEMGCDHPTLWSFIINLKKIQAGRDIYYNQLEAGRSPPKK
jgi:hypothetical protein